MSQSKLFPVNKTLNVGGRLIDLTIPKVMGIVNITPDSFYEGSRQSLETVVNKVEQMFNEGVDLVDVGGYSSRPNAKDIPEEEELKRALPVVQQLKTKFPDLIISIDTFRSEVARQCLNEGAALVNDISAGNLDEKMFSVVASAGVPYVMMHMRGTPQTMSQQTQYNHLVKEIIDYFHQRIFLAHQAGIKDIIIDPGFGFAKTIDQNFELLGQLNRFQVLGKPMLVGLSRKSMIWRTLEISPEEALNGTTSINTIALMHGASIFRVHDVKEAKECIKLFGKMKQLSAI